MTQNSCRADALRRTRRSILLLWGYFLLLLLYNLIFCRTFLRPIGSNSTVYWSNPTATNGPIAKINQIFSSNIYRWVWLLQSGWMTESTITYLKGYCLFLPLHDFFHYCSSLTVPTAAILLYPVIYSRIYFAVSHFLSVRALQVLCIASSLICLSNNTWWWVRSYGAPHCNFL
jgi:hypothetical protein